MAIDSRQETLLHIAKQSLGLETLETRKSDSLDFHDLAVWQIREALQQAYEAGRTAEFADAARRTVRKGS